MDVIFSRLFIKHILLFFAAMFITLAVPVYAAQQYVMQDIGIMVFFEPSLETVAKKVIDIYPAIREDLEEIFGWDADLRPSVLLTRDRRAFKSLAETPPAVAFAVPDKNLIVIDCSMMNAPFSFGSTLTHELCHLLLHHHIEGSILPRWLDEGIAQWAGGGISNIIMDQKRSSLNRASLTGRYIPLDLLKDGFPRDDRSIILAYEQSRSFVAHIIAHYGKDGLMRVLGEMRRGEDVDTAFLKAFSTDTTRLEKEWHKSLRQKTTWFIYLSYYLYEILFALMAFISLFAFIKAVIRKRAYMAEETDEHDGN